MAGLLDLIRRAAPGSAPVDPMAGSVMSPGYIPETDKRQLALGGLRGLLDVSPVGLMDAATSAINRANVPSLAAVRAVTGRQGLPGDAMVGLLGQGGGSGYEAARSATQAVVPMMGLLGNQSAGRLPAGYARDQSGAIVWHGSPHKFAPEEGAPFGRFRADKIGTGEGAQAYGHGHYLAENKGTGQFYREKLQDSAHNVMIRTIQKSGVPDDFADRMFSLLYYSKFTPQEAAQALSQTRVGASIGEAKLLEIATKAAAATPSPGALYKVDLPDEAIARMLDWDKPLHRQAPAVRHAVRDVVDSQAAPGTYAEWVRANRPDFSNLRNDMLEHLDEAQIAELLRQRGVTGVRYLDGGSRGAGTGTSNYVVFPGEEGLLKILSRE